MVDFSARIISKSSELSRSCNGRLVQHTDISTTSDDLKRLTTKLSVSIADPAVPTVLSEDEQALHVLCRGCVDVSTELQDGLNKLQVKGVPSKWKSLRKALKTIWTKEHISELQSRLSDYRGQLDSRILIGLKAKLDLVALQQSESFDQLDHNVKDLVQTLLDFSADLKLEIQHRADVMDAKTESVVHLARDSVIEAVEDTGRAHQRDIQAVETQLAGLHTFDEQILTATGESRNEILTNIASSSAVSSEEHERMKAELTQQWKSAEQQIAQLREEIKQIESRIGQSIREAVSSKSKAENKKQKKLKEETNLLYKVLVAKDLMLQTLLVGAPHTPVRLEANNEARI